MYINLFVVWLSLNFFPVESYDSMTSLLSHDPRQLTSRRGGVGNLSPGTPTLTALLSPSSKKVGR